MEGYGIVRLYCSTMHRSLETATTIGDAIGVRSEVWIDLHGPAASCTSGISTACRT